MLHSRVHINQRPQVKIGIGRKGVEGGIDDKLERFRW